MKTVALICRVLLGFVFVVFGSNIYFHFLKMPPPEGQAGAFMGAMFGSGYMYAVAAFQVVGGLILLTGRFIPLGLTLLGPVIVNIMFFHIFLAPAGLPLAIVVSVLALVLLYYHRQSFAGLVKA
jgi:hypothetical protein